MTINNGITPELKELITQEVFNRKSVGLKKDDYENILRRCDFNYFQVSNVFTARCVVGLINSLTGNNFVLSQMDMEKYIDFDKAVQKVLTKDEFYEMLGRMRKFALSMGISFRELVMIEMLWLTTPSKDMVYVLDEDVQCVKLPDQKAVFYTYNGVDYYDKNGDFYDDFVRYRQEIKGGNYISLRVKNGKTQKMNYSYANTEFFLRKSRIGSEKESAGLESARDFLCRPERAMQKFFDLFCAVDDYAVNMKIKEFSTNSIVNSGILYGFQSKEKPREGFKNLYELYKFETISDVHLEFYEKCSERLYRNTVPS